MAIALWSSVFLVNTIFCVWIIQRYSYRLLNKVSDTNIKMLQQIEKQIQDRQMKEKSFPS